MTSRYDGVVRAILQLRYIKLEAICFINRHTYKSFKMGAP